MKKKRSPSDQARRTPPWLIKLLQQELKVKFVLDASASPDNAVCRKYYALERNQNGLTLPWAGSVKKRELTFCNPGFKRFGEWTKKAMREWHENQVPSLLIGPTGCSQTWFHRDCVEDGCQVFVPDQRIVFYASDGSGPTHGADRDTMCYLFGLSGKWAQWNQFEVYSLPVHGKVVVKR